MEVVWLRWVINHISGIFVILAFTQTRSGAGGSAIHHGGRTLQQTMVKNRVQHTVQPDLPLFCTHWKTEHRRGFSCLHLPCMSGATWGNLRSDLTMGTLAWKWPQKQLALFYIEFLKQTGLTRRIFAKVRIKCERFLKLPLSVKKREDSTAGAGCRHLVKWWLFNHEC